MTGSRRFRLGQVLITPMAQQRLAAAAIDPRQLIIRHHQGDWGDVCLDDATLNDQALQHGGRLLSAYTIGNDKIWIITEADRSATTLLMPEEY